MITKFSFGGKPIYEGNNTVDIEEIVGEVVCAVIGGAVKSAIQPLCKSNDTYHARLAAIDSKMYAFDQAMGRELRKLQTMVADAPTDTQYNLGSTHTQIDRLHKQAGEIKERVEAIWQGSKIRDSHTHKRLDALETLIMQIPSLKEAKATEEAKIKDDAEAKAKQQKEAGLDLLIGEIELSVRSHNCLRNDGYKYIRDLVVKTPAELLRTPNFGHKSLHEIRLLLASMGLKLGMDIDSITTSLPPSVEPPKHYKELLSERAFGMVNMRHNDNDKEEFYETIGAKYRLSGARVNQIIKKAIYEMRRYYENQHRVKGASYRDILAALGDCKKLYQAVMPIGALGFITSNET